MKLSIVFSILILAFTCKSAVMLENTTLNFNNFTFGERIKALLATELWNRADKLMHNGSIDTKTQKFQAGSYIGNTDITPLLKAIIFLKPNELITYKMLAQNYIYSKNGLDNALKILIQGIIANQKHKELYELYIEIAKLKMFYSDTKSEKTGLSALKYLEKALIIYPDNIDYKPFDTTMTKENINILIARIYIELNKPQNALEHLLGSNISLDSSDDIIFKYLKQYKEFGISDKSVFNSFNHEINHNNENHIKHSHIKNNNNKKNNLSLKPNYLILKTGLVFFLCVLTCCYL